MTSIGQALNIALTGMQATQIGLAVGAQNIANANTPGFTRKVAEFETNTLDGAGSGVSISDVNRLVNTFLSKALREQRSELAAVEAKSSFFDQVQIQFGTTASDSTLSADLSRLGTAIEALSNLPEDAALRFDMVSLADSLAKNIRDFAASIQDLRAEADASIKVAVDDINRQLKNIFDLNADIAAANNANVPTAELEDERDKALNAISKHIDVQIFARDNGNISVLAAGGIILLDSSLNQIQYDSATFVTATTPFNSMKVVPEDQLGNLATTAGVTIVTGGVSSAVVSQISSGDLKGLLEIRDSVLPNLAAQIDVLSNTVRDEFNRVHNRGTSFPAPNSLTGTRLVSGADAFAATGIVRLAVVDASGDLVNAALDLDLTTVTTVDQVVNAINNPVTGLLGATASISAAGNLIITANNAANGIAINENTSQITGTTTAFSQFFGLNDLFVGTDSTTIAVRAAILANPSLVATGQLSLTADVTHRPTRQRSPSATTGRFWNSRR